MIKYRILVLIMYLGVCLFPVEGYTQTGNTLYGTNAGGNITTGDSIVAIGANAARLNEIGSRHVIIGANAGYNLNHNPSSPLGQTNFPTGGSIYLGYHAGYHTTSAKNNIFIGDQSGYLNTTGNDNTYIGAMTGMSNTTGRDNVFIGTWAGLVNTTGRENIFIGEQSGYRNTTGNKNTFVGRYSGFSNTSGTKNTFIGYLAGRDNNTGHRNTALGDSTLNDVGTGIHNTALGASAGANVEHASYNTFVGAYAGWDCNRANSTTRANHNTYVGSFAGYTNRLGEYNVGFGSGADVTQAIGNPDLNNTVFIGANSVASADGVTIVGKSSQASGANGIAIGLESSVTASNAIAIGYQSSATVDNEVVIGNASHTTIGGSVNWTATSDGRFKREVKENVVGLEFINQLRPVTYLFDGAKVLAHKGKNMTEDLAGACAAKDSIRYTGFIAQEVEQAAMDTDFNFSGVDKPTTSEGTDYYGLRYAEFVVPLVKAVQELSKENELLKNKNQEYESTLQSLLERVEQLEQNNLQLVNLQNQD